MPAQESRRRPPGRYDERRALPDRRTLTVGAGLLAALLLVGSYLLFARYTARHPTAGVTGFTVVSDRAVEVRFSVRKQAGSTAYCLVRARDAYGAQVGAETVRIGPAPGASVQVAHRLATSARANTGEVDGCSRHA